MKAGLVALLLGTALCLQAHVGMAQDGDVGDRLLDCRRQADEAARLACYDQVADGLSSAEATVAEAAPVRPEKREETAEAASRAAVTGPPVDEDDPSVVVRVVECRRLPDNDYLFSLDNGEYWRQAGGYPLRLSDCEFEATLVKDFFGYKMQFSHNGQEVRVKRVQ